MNRLVRWSRFNLVGAMGMVVQLAALGFISRCVPGHYLIASAAAMELALVHNFAWHLRYTWRDRGDGSRFAQFIRFQLSNGMVSLAGNLVLMKLLVGGAHLPVLAANGLAILVCSIVNFSLGDQWAFA